MIEEEANGGCIKPEEEISMLETEGEIPIEQMKAMYANIRDMDSDDEDEEDQEDNELSLIHI